MDLKSIRLCLRRFKSCRCRIFYIFIMYNTYKYLRKWYIQRKNITEEEKRSRSRSRSHQIKSSRSSSNHRESSRQQLKGKEESPSAAASGPGPVISYRILTGLIFFFSSSSSSIPFYQCKFTATNKVFASAPGSHPFVPVLCL